MPYGLTDAGFVDKPLEVIVEEQQDHLLETVTPAPDLGSTSAEGQRLIAASAQLRQLWEALQLIVASLDPYQATGARQDALYRLTIGERLAADYDRVTLTVNLDAGTYDAGDLRVSVAGYPQYVFDNDDQVVTAGGDVDVAFTATTTGKISAPPWTITVIEPLTGFNSATNASASAGGRDAETNAEYLARWEADKASGGLTTVPAIRGKLLEQSSISYAQVYENTTGATVDTIGPWGIEAVVEGGTAALVAQTILGARGAARPTYGTSNASVLDSQNVSQTIYFTRPTSVPIEMELTVSWRTGTYASAVEAEAAFKTAINTAFLSQQVVGRDVEPSYYEHVLWGLGTITAASCEQSRDSDPLDPAAVVITKREKATLDADNDLTFVLTEVPDYP